MKLKTTLTLAALAAVGVNAGATNVTNWSVLGPIASVATPSYAAGASTAGVDDVYTFTIGAKSDVDGYGEEFEARSVSMPNATFTLYSGTWGGPATQVGSPHLFTNDEVEVLYTNLASGAYYFRITSAATSLAVSYDFEAYANNSLPPSNVPEPGNVALLLAGAGLVGFLGRRRQPR